jgi:hypothetical protein
MIIFFRQIMILGGNPADCPIFQIISHHGTHDLALVVS